MIQPLFCAAVAAALIGRTALACSPINTTRDLTPRNTTALINDSLEALGGREAIASLRGVTYESDGFRVSTLMENYKLLTTDRYIVNEGTQNVSFSFEDDFFSQRIDREFKRSDFFFFVSSELLPGSFSLVLKSGPEGYGCYTEGNNNAFIPSNQTAGYADSALTEYLLFQALKLSPKLLLEVEKHNNTALVISVNGVEHPAVRDEELNVLVIFDPDTYLPHIIRSFEDHAIFGVTTNDLQLFDYAVVSGIKFPQHRMVIYNGDAILEDTTVAAITVDPGFPEDFFSGLDSNETETTPAPPAKIEGYSHAEIGEYWYNTFWGGEYTGTYQNISVTQPVEELPGVHWLLVKDNPNLQQLVLEFEDSLIVFEAPPHQTDLVIRWVNETLGKPITHLWPSHHHHDHAYEVKKYVELGAKIIVPEVSRPLWSQIPDAQLVTFTDAKPYIHSDSQMQARFLWRPEALHAVDWTYSIITTRCPQRNDTIMAYEADAWSTSFKYDNSFARYWLEQASADGMSRNTLVVPAHGKPTPLQVLIDALDFDYPAHQTTDFHNGGNICLG